MLVRSLLLFLFFFFIARALWRLLEGVVRGASGSSGDAASAPRRSQAPPAVKMAQCPTCGIYVVPSKALPGVSQGHAAYFCSEQCRSAS